MISLHDIVRLSKALTRVSALLCLLVVTFDKAEAQSIPIIDPDAIQGSDSLSLAHEHWLGAAMTVGVALAVGQHNSSFSAGELEGESLFHAQTRGGQAFQTDFVAMYEYRPFGSKLQFGGSLGLSYLDVTSTSLRYSDTSMLIYNAWFESVTRSISLAIAPMAKYVVSDAGAYIGFSVRLDVPVIRLTHFLWQHEELMDDGPTGEDGSGTTSIRFRSASDLVTRVGAEISAGHDFLVGLFGYTGQLITPFVSVNGGTSIFEGNSSLSLITFRFGVQWRSAL